MHRSHLFGLPVIIGLPLGVGRAAKAALTPPSAAAIDDSPWAVCRQPRRPPNHRRRRAKAHRFPAARRSPDGPQIVQPDMGGDGSRRLHHVDSGAFRAGRRDRRYPCSATLFGRSAADNLSSGPGMFVGADCQGRPKRGLLEFDVPAYVPSDAIITGATLTLFLGMVAWTDTGDDQTPRTIRLYDVSTAWTGSSNGNSGFPGPGFGSTGQGFPANIGDATWNDAKYNTVPWNTRGGGGDFAPTEGADTLIGENVKHGLHLGLDHPNGGRRTSLARRHAERRMAAQERCRNRADHASRVFYERGSDRAGGAAIRAGSQCQLSRARLVSEPSSLWLTALGGFAVVLIVRGQLSALQARCRLYAAL